ncbi:hypothetical protein RIF29_23981 [Crotalaria pallida]|uniref:Uncharacterized protein n=1 Tax=Crotalaria pallida TaxID=3830 RepID=A0AAN9ELD2_CROPI
MFTSHIDMIVVVSFVLTITPNHIELLLQNILQYLLHRYGRGITKQVKSKATWERERELSCKQMALEYKASSIGNMVIDGVHVEAAQNPHEKMLQKLVARNGLAAFKEKEVANSKERSDEKGKKKAALKVKQVGKSQDKKDSILSEMLNYLKEMNENSFTKFLFPLHRKC